MPENGVLVVTRMSRHVTKTIRIDTLWVTMLAYEEDYEEDYSMVIKVVVTEKGPRVFICYNTMLIMLNPSQNREIHNMSEN